jgi:hypothetical protein
VKFEIVPSWQRQFCFTIHRHAAAFVSCLTNQQKNSTEKYKKILPIKTIVNILYFLDLFNEQYYTLFLYFSTCKYDAITYRNKPQKEEMKKMFNVQYIFCYIVSIRYERKTVYQLHFCWFTVVIIRVKRRFRLFSCSCSNWTMNMCKIWKAQAYWNW